MALVSSKRFICNPITIPARLYGVDLAKKTFHTTSVQAAEIAVAAAAKKLLIGHFSSRYNDISFLLDEARTIFPETYAANDGDCYEL